MFDHLKENNVGYWQHLSHSAVLGMLSIMAGVIFLIHAVFPFLFPYTGSGLIKKIQKRFYK